MTTRYIQTVSLREYSLQLQEAVLEGYRVSDNPDYSPYNNFTFNIATLVESSPQIDVESPKTDKMAAARAAKGNKK